MKRAKIRKIYNQKRFEKDACVLIGGYFIPISESSQYLTMRKFYTNLIINFFKKHSDDVSVDFQGSQDGEAVVARDKKGEIIALIHIDPYNLEIMQAEYENGKLEEFLKEYCF
ncbi:hypothetical protein [Campylobacter geochelonis]|uniref:Uncharacterized protein n=1 Tax=Campylobacter geochelonis TaxID=1780362 RepID=A0A128EBN3_9BACT|nr:hypothetical protein [Campylobacter geochelonis]QKF70441.1 hypothetical protein CGEO_0100 [Campylobacter geochelonis]CZE46286.1 Uncharacterised protein [Campylobacter geochelonis]CZE46349.1 Uncharacterised protein [Campylobacter geochelonis]CZE50672.1 Uncharacterised protein [Campylobacter geochelonis]